MLYLKNTSYIAKYIYLAIKGKMKKYLMDPKALKMIDQIGDYFKGLPHLPEGIVDFFVKIAPFFAIIGGILNIFSSLSMLAVYLNFRPFYRYSYMGMGYGQNYLLLGLILAILQITMGALLIMAFKPLQERTKLGWVYMYYTVVISIIMTLVSLVFASGNIISSVFWILVDMYLIYEMRPSYGKAAAKKD